ncbi:MAG: YHS domain-containing protein [Propionicimonas sp.]|uniref:YHS domain-containing protein n=1 Tax=Propionicimonas sp. TaxID=1955623 RepID=UPI003D0ECE5C
MTTRTTEECPVCGAAVDAATAPSAVHDAQTYHFCSDECREAFLADPGRHVGNTGS